MLKDFGEIMLQQIKSIIATISPTIACKKSFIFLMKHSIEGSMKVNASWGMKGLYAQFAPVGLP